MVTRKWSRKILGKVVSPKIFRHSRFTDLSDEEVDTAILGMYGIKPDEAAKPVLELITCKRCGVRALFL
ncbi:hypothetical protein KEJ39_04255 [Candidatus Bathyarchaeota archaeon]|nr:hypothetical protein [Candidatus Bathyarchaeota archaeon]